MKKYTIEVDEMIMNYLKREAEPFVDTPNTVLHRLLFETSSNHGGSKIVTSSFGEGTPKALTQILEVVTEVVVNKHTRPEATKIVAARNGIALQTIIDKYCRQLGKTASEVDMLLSEHGLYKFRVILTNKFPNHSDLIVSFFSDLNSEGDKMEQIIQNQIHYREPSVRSAKADGHASERKKRDTALESALKKALGEKLEDKFGRYDLRGQSQLVFNNAQVLCKFSSFHDDQNRWFWGVSKIYWESWNPTDYLALIMENQDQVSYSFVILYSDEARYLFSVCSESAGEKKINMRIYADDNVIRFQEWKEFDVETRTQSLDLQMAGSFSENREKEMQTTKQKPILSGTERGDKKMFSFQELKTMEFDKRHRPQIMLFGNQRFSVNDWSDLWVQLLNHLVKTNKLNENHLPIFSHSSRQEKYLINIVPKHYHPEKNGNWKKVGNFYVDVKYRADAHFKNLVHLFEHLGIPNNDLAISFR